MELAAANAITHAGTVESFVGVGATQRKHREAGGLHPPYNCAIADGSRVWTFAFQVRRQGFRGEGGLVPEGGLQHDPLIPELAHRGRGETAGLTLDNPIQVPDHVVLVADE